MLAALLFALASVAQQYEAVRVPVDDARGVRLILRLARRPLWWAGFGGDTAGYVAQAAAIGLGSLLLVQPLLVTNLLFALPLAAFVAKRRLARADWGWMAVLTVALAAFVVLADPTAGVDQAPLRDWLRAGAVLGPALALLGAVAARTRGAARALALASAAGIFYGVLGAVTKSSVDLLGDGPLALLTHWEPYGVAVCGIVGTVLQQSAYQAAPLEASLPALTVLEPVVGALLGVTVLGERVRAEGVEWLFVAVAVAGMVLGTIALARASARVAVSQDVRLDRRTSC